MKRLWVIAGPNGAGKTTLTSSYVKKNLTVINPDVIAKITFPNSFNEPISSIAASKQALKEREILLRKAESFAIETTLSGKQELEFIKKAKDNGYKINLIFIGVNSADTSIGRVNQRVSTGGHSVNIVDIKRRYQRSMENLSKAIQYADRVVIIDNDVKARILLKIEHNKIKTVSRNIPLWAKSNLSKNFFKENELEM